MKIRRSMVVLFIISTFMIPISLYRSMFSDGASTEFLSTVDIISNVLMAVFLMLVFSFSLFTDDFPHAYNPRQSRLLGFVTILLAAAVGYSSVLGLISEDYSVFGGAAGKVFSSLGIISVLSFMFYSITYFKGENVIPSVAIVPVFPALWYGCRMLLCFLKSASIADISSQLPVIAMSCSFTIFFLTLGKLMCCINSNSIKWGFATGCVGIVTSFMYSLNWIVNDCRSAVDLLANPIVFADLFMALFAIGSLFHVSAPAEYFDDEQWDDYFYENYDLPKPNLILHTPVDELEEDNILNDEVPYIPSSSTVGSNSDRYMGDSSTYNQRQQNQGVPAQAPSYIANPAAYYPQYPPAVPPGQYYQPVYPAYPAYPPYPYQTMPPVAPPVGYNYYPQPAEYIDPYDTAAAQYQYERRRSELQNRELEMLTGEVDNSIAKLNSNVAQNQPPANEYVSASPDERIGVDSPENSGMNIRLNQGYIRSGERITDHLDRLEQENRQRNQQSYNDSEDDYTYEYYYPTDRARYNLNQFKPHSGNNGSNNNK